MTFALLSATPTASAADDAGAKSPRVPTYRERYTAESKNPPFPYDIHAWVYPSASAARFQMPEEWIDDGIEGSLAPNPGYVLSLRSPETFEAFLESDLNPAFAAW